MNARAPIVLAAGEGDKQSFLGGGLHTWKLLAENTEGAALDEALWTGRPRDFDWGD